MNRLDLAAGIFVYLALQGLVYAVDIVYRHGFDRTWPPHARYHLVISGIHIVALAAVTAVAAVSGLRQRRPTAWVTLAIVLTLGWAAWPVARLVEGEPPAGWVLLVTGGSFLAAVVALALSYRPVFKNGNPPA